MHKAKAIEKNGYFNEFNCDANLLTKELFIPLLQSSYKCFNKETIEPVDSDEVGNLT